MTSFPLVADISNYQPDEPAFFQALKNQGVKAADSIGADRQE